VALPTKRKFFGKFFAAVMKNEKLADAYCKRFRIVYSRKTFEEIWLQFISKLSNYGGYDMLRKLIEYVEIRQEEDVLDIGPEMGMECFLLAELYNKVLVAEPDAVTSHLLKGIAKYYYTEDGRRASDVLDIQRMGIIPPNSNRWKIGASGPSGLVSFDAQGAPDIGDVFGQNFADRILCNHIGWLIPAEPRLLVLLKALSSYCSLKGTITWCDEVCELSEIVVDYMKYQKLPIDMKARYYKYHAFVSECSLKDIRKCVEELLVDFNVNFRYFYKTGQMITMAIHC